MPEPTVNNLGWKEPTSTKSRKRKAIEEAPEDVDQDSDDSETGHLPQASTHRRKLLRELAARLHRDKQLRYTEREFEMQKLMMGKGARKKLKSVELVDGKKPFEDEDDEDALDARKGKPLLAKQQAPKTYTPRVYKWRAERKR